MEKKSHLKSHEKTKRCKQKHMNFGITQNFTTLEQKTINNDDETNHGTSKVVAEKFRTIICTTHIFRFNYMANKTKKYRRKSHHLLLALYDEKTKQSTFRISI